MSKILLALLIVFVCSISLEAQDSISRNAMAISAGSSIPYSDFAARTFTPRAGFAKAGANLDFEIIRYGRRGIFGMYADLGLANIFFDEKSYISEYERILNHEGVTSVTTGSYQFLTLHGGFLVRLVEFLDTRIILQTAIGYTLCRHPYLSAANSYWGNINTVNSDLDVQISSSAGIRVERTLNERTGIIISYGLFACKPDFSDSMSFMDYTFYLPVRYQNINIGLTRNF